METDLENNDAQYFACGFMFKINEYLGVGESIIRYCKKDDWNE
jgi:hypothetical protein